MSDQTKSDFSYNENMKSGDMSIDVQCLKRDELPDIVKPKVKQQPTQSIPARDPFAGMNIPAVGARRLFSQTMDPSLPAGLDHDDIVDFEEV
jgi:hypothetical protein